MKYLENESLYRERYRILKRLGEGGSSVVYIATDIETGRPVAIKLFKDDEYGLGERSFESGKQESSEDGIISESALLRRIDNPAVPGLIEEYEDGFAMEYVPGNSLEKVLRKKGPLKEKRAVAIGLEVLHVLEYLHESKKPVIYRDLKPANIMIKPDGHVALIDFGAARTYIDNATEDTLNLGTKGFAAPEQYGSLGQTDVRTDIYCFGKTLLQMTGGKCSPELMMVIDKCTRPDRDDRFMSCREIEAALNNYPRKKALRRMLDNLKLVTVAAAAALILSLGLANFDYVVSYASADAKERVPAVKERLGWAGVRIKEELTKRGLWLLEDKELYLPKELEGGVSEDTE